MFAFTSLYILIPHSLNRNNLLGAIRPPHLTSLRSFTGPSHLSQAAEGKDNGQSRSRIPPELPNLSRLFVFFTPFSHSVFLCSLSLSSLDAPCPYPYFSKQRMGVYRGFCHSFSATLFLFLFIPLCFSLSVPLAFTLSPYLSFVARTSLI
jgi:hypothetical protein